MLSSCFLSQRRSRGSPDKRRGRCEGGHVHFVQALPSRPHPPWLTRRRGDSSDHRDIKGTSEGRSVRSLMLSPRGRDPPSVASLWYDPDPAGASGCQGPHGAHTRPEFRADRSVIRLSFVTSSRGWKPGQGEKPGLPPALLGAEESQRHRALRTPLFCTSAPHI